MVLWFFVISCLSTDGFSAEETGARILPLLRLLFTRMSEGGLAALHIALRKVGHMAEFGILALLAYRSLAWRPSGWQGWSVPAAALLAVGLAVVDETHQAFTTSRLGSVTDVGWDALGILAALGGAWVVCWIRGRTRGWGRAEEAPTRRGAVATGQMPSRPQD